MSVLILGYLKKNAVLCDLYRKSTFYLNGAYDSAISTMKIIFF